MSESKEQEIQRIIPDLALLVRQAAKKVDENPEGIPIATRMALYTRIYDAAFSADCNVAPNTGNVPTWKGIMLLLENIDGSKWNDRQKSDFSYMLSYLRRRYSFSHKCSEPRKKRE